MDRNTWTEDGATITETITPELVQEALDDMAQAILNQQTKNGEYAMEKNWKDSEAKKRWDKENTVRYSIKLNKKKDADILAQVKRAGTAQKALKDAVRAKAGQDETWELLERRPKLAELIRSAAKLSPEHLQTVINIVDLPRLHRIGPDS